MDECDSVVPLNVHRFQQSGKIKIVRIESRSIATETAFQSSYSKTEIHQAVLKT